jgi:hypothetical protein
MTIEDRINIAKELIKKREDIDRQLAELFSGGNLSTRKLTCSIRGSDTHNARTCANREATTKQETVLEAHV